MFREQTALAPLSRSNSPFYSNNSNNRSSPVPSLSSSQPVSSRRSSPMVVSSGGSVDRPPRTTSAAGGTISPSARSWNSDYNNDGSESGASPPLNLQENLHNSNTDFLTEYTTIVDMPMRKRYKKSFNSVYELYMKYHHILHNCKTYFAELKAELQMTQLGSSEYKRIKAAIVQEFDKSHANGEWQEARTNFQYLHDKLAHIKSLVHDYDVMHPR